MVIKRKKKAGATAAVRQRLAPGRQRQRLIDACISALHLYGPSHTTVEKVVDLARLSPGIVRFYFSSKAAMLVASLEYLAADFEERVMVPVSQLRSTPLVALDRLIELYLDPDIASPRNVSVWYAFWGEASSRQEYYDICGQKDEGFARLVRELVALVVAEHALAHLDAEGVALGLIGALEVLWQDIAFQSEENIDRESAKRRGRAYLRSVFPDSYTAPSAGSSPERLSLGDSGDAGAFARERDRVFADSWQFAGEAAQLRSPGDYSTLELAGERVLLLRVADGDVRALRNSCPVLPHALLSEARGHLDHSIRCGVHDLEFEWDGRAIDRARREVVNLRAISVVESAGALFVRLRPPSSAAAHPLQGGALEIAGRAIAGFALSGDPSSITVEADWKLIVELWLGRLPWGAPHGVGVTFSTPGSWFSTLGSWQCRFHFPNEVSASSEFGAVMLQVSPLAAGRSLLRQYCWSRRGVAFDSPLDAWMQTELLRAAESAQRGMVDLGYTAATTPADTDTAHAWFRRQLRTSLEDGGAIPQSA